MQIACAVVFLYSGICKSIFPEMKLVKMGQTGVEGLHPAFIKFIGVSEIVGSIGLILPISINIWVHLTPISALCLAIIMPFAAIIHHRKKEPRNVCTNIILLTACILIAIGRSFLK